MGFLGAVVSWSLRNRPTVIVAMLLFVAFGIRSAVQLPIDVVPDVTNIQVQVLTSAPALSPLEVEQYISIPVERSMAGIPKVTEIRSLSKYGISVVTIVFEDDTDIYFARQQVAERMPEAGAAVPQRFGTPEMGPISTGLGEIYQFTVRNDDLDLMQLEEMLDWTIAPRLRGVRGVVELNSMGGFNRQYQVVVDPERLRSAGLSLPEVVASVERANGNAGGGYIEHAREQIVIGTRGLVHSLGDLENVVLGATPQGVPITVDMIGEVRFGPRLRHGAVSMDGDGEVVVGVVMLLMGENARVVIDDVKRELDELLPTLPPGTRIEPFYDRSELVARTIATVGTNLAEGAALVIVVLLVLLGDLRAGLVVATMIPLSMIGAVIVMDQAGFSGNLMSLGAIDFGLIVDGAVIIVENASRRLAEARAARGHELSSDEVREVVRDATLEVRRAAVFGEIIVAIVYVPVLLLTGIEGKLFSPMATTVLLALASAFVLSLTVVPVLTSLVVRPRHHHDTLVVRAALAVYRPVLARVLRHKLAVLSAGAAVVVAAGLVGSRLGAEFVPQLDEGDLLVELRRLPGVALSQSVAIDDRLQRALAEIHEVEHVVSKSGAPELAVDAMGIEQGDVYLDLLEREQWRPGLTKAELAEEISQLLERSIPDAVGAISQPIQMRTNEMVAGIRADVGIVVYGSDLAQLSALAAQILAAVEGVPGVEDLQAERLSGLRYLVITPDRPALARWGIDIADVNLLVESLAVGRSAGRVFEGDRRFDIVVRVAHGFAGDTGAIAALPLRRPDGGYVALGDVAAVRFETGPVLVNRSEQSRRLIVQFNVRGRDLVSTVSDARAAVAAAVELPLGYRVVWGGTFRHYEDAKARLTIVVPAVLVIIVFLLWLALESLPLALIIFLAVPLSASGGIFALHLRGIPFSISAAVGFIALFGVAVLNGLVLVTVAKARQAEGATPLEAVKEACERRLRPVLTTALVAALGFVPMALSTAPGSEVQRPLATVVIGGLISATLLTLLVLPAVYAKWVRAPR